MKTTIQYGPQHPVWVEPIRLKLNVDGEFVKDVEYEGGFVHRGIEKRFEFDYNKGPYLAERVCGICSTHHSTCYCLAAEKTMNLEVSRRATIIRTIICELERLHSHILAVGLTLEAIGFENLFMLCFRTRESVLDVFERVTGNRVLHGHNIVGGVTRNIGPEMAKEMSDFCDELEKKCHDLENMIVNSYTIKQRMKGIGIMSEKLARDLAVVGPVARGSNVAYDVRHADPYIMYDEVKVEPIVEKDGDCWARSIVRVREWFQSIDIIRQCLPLLDGTPDEIFVKSKALPEGEHFARVEAPRGELFYYLRGKKSKELDRVKIRTSTYGNAPGIVPLVKGCHLADVGFITVTFDPCIGCIDR
ncbi:NiFe hydrogenase [Methanocella sp. CWC-04]|uniref:NiFe hydrogenase n=1 Tax=Methanooceanicella nereidis TaxID=2052831 RepID=A0AAP2RBC1_9EURY|nr:nickel-dependent hydrogenase large subunit [Methanocella sp. CWC-04]MCD1294421.1 NiFe hydrogenase [Methanocella sp. CWC-04]